MDQTLLPPKNQSDNKNAINIPPSSSNLLPPLPPERGAQTALNQSAPNNDQPYKLATSEVQGPKPPLVSNSNSKFALIAIVLVLLIFAGVGGYYLYTKDNNPQPVNSPAIVSPKATPPVSKSSDSDKDGLPDAIEKVLGTDINNSDSDDDTFLDLAEIKSGYSPLIAGGAGKYTPEQRQAVEENIRTVNPEFYNETFNNTKNNEAGK